MQADTKPIPYQITRKIILRSINRNKNNKVNFYQINLSPYNIRKFNAFTLVNVIY